MKIKNLHITIGKGDGKCTVHTVNNNDEMVVIKLLSGGVPFGVNIRELTDALDDLRQFIYDNPRVTEVDDEE